jgi:hypothetical protein
MKTIIIYNHYELNSSGQITNLKTGRVLKPWKRNGYYNLRCGAKGEKFQVHRLVATYFIANPENKPQVNHIDGNKLNNDYQNLEWVSARENMVHAMETGLWKRKKTYKVSKHENHYMTKLSKENVIEMRELYKTGNYSYRQLGEKYDIHLATVGYIIQGKTWKDI